MIVPAYTSWIKIHQISKSGKRLDDISLPKPSRRMSLKGDHVHNGQERFFQDVCIDRIAETLFQALTKGTSGDVVNGESSEGDIWGYKPDVVYRDGDFVHYLEVKAIQSGSRMPIKHNQLTGLNSMAEDQGGSGSFIILEYDPRTLHETQIVINRGFLIDGPILADIYTHAYAHKQQCDQMASLEEYEKAKKNYAKRFGWSYREESSGVNDSTNPWPSGINLNQSLLNRLHANPLELMHLLKYRGFGQVDNYQFDQFIIKGDYTVEGAALSPFKFTVLRHEPESPTPYTPKGQRSSIIKPATNYVPVGTDDDLPF